MSFLRSHPHLAGTIVTHVVAMISLIATIVLIYLNRLRRAIIGAGIALLPLFYGIFFRSYDSLYNPALSRVYHLFLVIGFPMIVLLLITIFLHYRVGSSK